MGRYDLGNGRILFATDLGDKAAARSEWTAGQNAKQVGRQAANRLKLGFGGGVEPRQGIEETDRVRMRRARIELIDWRLFDA